MGESMTNCLKILLSVFGWNGGTIHQVKEHFKSLSYLEKRKALDALEAERANIQDLDNWDYFVFATFPD